ncbi:transcription antitermination factor NusB [Sinomicrobium soli]|uniref:transcription antitermination factor NusB n=1 Tax=Sinomicrobium sp. N-1-3-6 TaxID=2219864 RepID=UPI000DCE3A1D|nr:transcription antitermination factor NusB [Sinomicrobium sp. N-1-3-6]RAV30592.1 transcription antitermination factor NusB [Sinomicrobium sp. N-1-3-6]
MLTRRHIRVKVMQSIYALTQSQRADLDKEEKFLSTSMENMYDLYLVLLNLLRAMSKMAGERLSASEKKYLATEEEKNPNRKFVDNRVISMLVNNISLSDELENRKLNNWYLDEEYVKVLLREMQESGLYQSYMATRQSSFKEDKEFLQELFRDVIAPNEKLYEYIEDYNLTWVDDLPLVNTFILKQLRKVKPADREGYFLPRLFKDEDDRLFARELFRKTLLNDEMLVKEIAGKTPNWDTDRIAEVDEVLLKMAICEFLKFPSIPVKVTMNEYLEIAKEYSTPKSSIFINGILDKMVKDFQSGNKLNKAGRGLM